MSEPRCFRVPLARYPGANRFVLDWLAGDEKATRFLPRAATSRQARSADPALSAALIESNRHWGLFVQDDVDRWASGEAIALIAGQQVGFAGGPLYTLAKIATLIRMKRDLEAKGRAATAFFWLATEDHDFDEVASLALQTNAISRDRDINRQLDLVALRAMRGADGHVMVGGLPIPESLVTQLTALLGISRPSWLRHGITFRDSFAELISTAFGSEIVLVDALLPELRRAGQPLFDAINARWNDVQQAIGARSDELRDAGYSQQVVPRDGESFTLFFEIGADGSRRAIDEPRALPAERTSTSALTRPLLQDFVLRPDVFVGGPAEVAYYAQIAPLHELLNVAMPRVALRGHALIAPKRVLRAIDRFELDPAELFQPADVILAEKEPEGVARIREIAASAEQDFMIRIEQLADLALPADHALARAFEKSVGHLEYHFDKLVERSIRGLVRKDKQRHAAVRELVATLHPDGKVQDRIAGWIALWCEYDRYVIDRLIDCIAPDSSEFAIIGL